MAVILHSDLNNFYATCECLVNPELMGLPVVVCGKIENRHGVVLAKNQIAKNAGIKTGMTLVEAIRLMPNLRYVEAHHDLYLKYSRLVKKIYYEYTDKVESFGIDEAWLDVTESTKIFGDGKTIAEIIRKRVKEEIGLTVSIGVSFNKIFAKLGSDIKKPDAITEITKDNYKDIVWKLPVSDLLFVGRATTNKLNLLGIYTIGSLARYDFNIIKHKLGKVGEKLWNYANGLDDSKVVQLGDADDVKSVGNSVTYYRDMETQEDVNALLFMLAESVAYRMKKSCVGKAKTLHLSVVDSELNHYGMQTGFATPTNLSSDIAQTAIDLFVKNYTNIKSVRGLGVSVSNFVEEEQLLLGEEQLKKEKMLKLDCAVEDIRRRFGRNAVSRALTVVDPKLQDVEINGSNITSRVISGNQSNSTNHL